MITDQQARQLALDPTQSFIVQAPAGSGKTELLTQRFLRLLTTVNEPEEIIAITFTKKAAAEMRHRILSALLDAKKTDIKREAHKHITFELASSVLQHDANNNWHLLRNPNRLRVWTIDSFNGFLSAKTPILAGFGSKPTIEEQAHLLYDEAARELVRSLATPSQWQEHLKRALNHLDNKVERVVELLKKILSKREQWLPHVFAYHGDMDVLQQKLNDSLINIATENSQHAIDLMDDSLVDQLTELAQLAAKNLFTDHKEHALLTFLEDGSLFAHEHHLDKWQALTTLLLTQTNDWRKQVDARLGFPPKSTEKMRITELLESLIDHDALRDALINLRLTPTCHYPEAQQSMIEALIHLLPILCAELRLAFQRHNAIDFIELNLAALRALGDDDEPTDLALYLDYQIKHLLIDEFQDTSITQFTLLERLIRGWEPHDGRSLFLVGDPMQSIYRFRDAEVGLFLRAQTHGINSLALHPLTLQHNYRSDKTIIDWINNTFNSLLPQKANMMEGAVPYSPSIATRDYQAAGLHFYGLQTTHKQTEALHVVTTLKNIRAKNPHDTVAILVRSRNHLTKITHALQNAHIAYNAVDLQKLSDCSTIKDLLTLTRALLHRDDRIAWYGLLRSPICGLTLDELHVIATRDTSKTIWQTITDSTTTTRLSADGQQRIKRILPILTAYFNDDGRKPFELALKGVWQLLGFSAIATKHQKQNADRYFKLVADLISKKSTLVIDELLEALNKTYSEPEKTPSTIFAMTIHKAKGLEFDHVLLPGLNYKSHKDDSELMLWLEKPNDAGLIDFIIAPIKHAHENNEPIYDYLKHIEQKKLTHESTRLLYVAVTRAKKSLHLYANVPNNAKNEPHYHAGSFAHMLDAYFNANLIQPVEHVELIDHQLEPPLLTRLPSGWQAMHDLPKPSGIIHDNPLPIAQDAFKRLVGTVIHEKIAFPDRDITHRLKELGIAKHDLPKALDMIQIAMVNMQHDPRAQWILNPAHTDIHAEYAITSVIDGKLRHLIIDRTFIDNGTRWIIDYKTSIPEPHESQADFMAREQQAYSEQLTTYAKAMAALDNHPIKMGLYFPMFGGWREVFPC